MKHYDGNTGIAVLSVPKEQVDTDTMNAISVAKLGNSLTTMQGTMVIAVGSPLGTNYSILTGNITSTNNVISTIDNNYTVFTTDIVGSSSGSGVIINVNGEVIGLVMQDYGNEEDQTTLTAISISELKQLIEKLSNNQDIPYIGLELTTVSAATAKEYDIPKGAYIKDVKMDSPHWRRGCRAVMSLQRWAERLSTRWTVMRASFWHWNRATRWRSLYSGRALKSMRRSPARYRSEC